MSVRCLAGLTALVFLFLAGCGGTERPAAQLVKPAAPLPQVEKVTAWPSQTPVPSPTRSIQAVPDVLPVYVIDALMDYDAKTLDVRQTIDFTNNAGVAITDMLLAVLPNQIPGVFQLTDLMLGNQEVTDYRLNGQRLSWRLAAQLQPGETVLIKLVYSLRLPVVATISLNSNGNQVFGVHPLQVNLTDWYPMLVPFDPETGWKLADPQNYGEHMVYPLANFEVKLRFVNPDDIPVIAASAPAEEMIGGWRYVFPKARDFSLALGRQFKFFKTDVDGVIVSSYYYAGNENRARAVLNTTATGLKTFSALFGPYPHKSLAVVQTDYKDGMEFDGLFYLSKSFYNLYDGTPNNILVMLSAHETSHQWWFGRVASDQSGQPWLDEALATYCEELYYEKNFPASVNWWWDYRIDYHEPWGWIDLNVSRYGSFTPYTNATYRLGARFYRDLRKQMGDAAFFAFLRDYADQMDGEIATTDDFFRILRLHTSADLSPLVAKYFANPPGKSAR